MSAGPKTKLVVMIGPALDSRGGVAGVCAEYYRAGVFDRLQVVFLASFVTAGAGRKLAQAAWSAWALARLLLRGQVALVHVHVAWGASVWRKALYCLMARVAGVPYLVHLHSGKLQSYYAQHCGPLRRAAVAALVRHSAGVMVLTAGWADWLASQGLRAPWVEVLPNFVLVPPQPSAASAGQENLVFLGRLEEAKGMSTLVDAFARVANARPQARLLLGGEGDQARYAQQAAKLGVADRVQFLGWVTGAAKDALLRRATVFVLPSLFEGLPVSMLEAMSLAVPCVATPVGGVPDIVVDGVNGILVPVGQSEPVAVALERLLADPQLRAELGRAARETVIARFSAGAVEAQLAHLYAKAKRA